MRPATALLLVAFLGGGTAALGDALSPRNASYTIEVRLDPAARTLEGRQVLEWTNITDVPADELRFHLYWNAWRNERSTWMREEALTGDLKPDVRREDWGWIQVDRIRALGAPEAVDLTTDAR
ncbi:MAG: hypothetical protein PVG07_16130, partial [Acidobacteriota bacterium]